MFPPVHTGPEVVNKFVCDYTRLKIVLKDLGRSSDKNLRKTIWDIYKLWSYGLKS